MDLLSGDLVRVRLVGAADDIRSVSQELAAELETDAELTAVPTVEARPGGEFGVLEVVQDFIVGAGVEVTGMAVAAAVQQAIARIRKRRKAAANDESPSVTNREEGVVEIVVRLRVEE